MNNKKLIYYREYPLDVEIGLFNEIKKQYPNEIIVICHKNFDNDRKICNWDNAKINIKTIILNKNVDKYINLYKDDIHIFHGIVGKNRSIIRKCINSNKNFKFFITAERPNIYGNVILKTLRLITRKIYYSLYAKIYKKHILGFFSMGEKAKKKYTSYGFDKTKTFPFMYNLELHDKKLKTKNNNKLKILYIGRFCDSTKGLDILRKAFDKIPSNWNISLDMVGGYGKNAGKNICWANKTSRVKYIGKWDYDKVYSNMQKYDICIVPSRYDGWNLSPNQAIDAGIGVIISDNATSDELVKYANNGMIFKAGDVKSLLKSITYIYKNRDIIKQWCNNSLKYKKNISNEKICKYFLNAITYSINGYKGEIPKAPWIITN